MGKKHPSGEEAESGKVRRLVDFFSGVVSFGTPNKVTPSSHHSSNQKTHTTDPIKRTPRKRVKHKRQHSISESLWKEALHRSMAQNCRSPSSPSIPAPAVRLYQDGWNEEEF